MSESSTANKGSADLPPYIDRGNTSTFTEARLRFYILLAALYASPKGTLRGLAERLGKSPEYFNGIDRGVFKTKMSGDLALAIERASYGYVTRKDLRPDLFA